MSKKRKIEINPKFSQALTHMENTSDHLFITGRAGTGKSTLLELFRSQTDKKIVVLAPTGVAALNIKGQTIHSFFKFKPDVTLQAIKKINPSTELAQTVQKIDTIIIDEISMVRADLLDCVEKFLRLNGPNKQMPFGGIQMVFIGDLYQLPPVVTGDERHIFRDYYSSPYFFSAKCLENISYEIIELEKIYRQRDNKFIDLLNSIRDNSITSDRLEILNARVQPDFAEAKKHFYIYLTTTNREADEINAGKLSQVKKPLFTAEGIIQGTFDTKSLPTAVSLDIKIDSQIMMLNNDSQGRWVNGSIGQVVNLKTETTADDQGNDTEITFIIVKFPDGRQVEVSPFTWELFNFTYNPATNELTSETVGTFTQYPMKLSWAVTIHKSQGKTFDHVILDIGRGAFAHGQVYVALSRCTSFEGLILKKPILKHHIFMDHQVTNFLNQFNNPDLEY